MEGSIQGADRINDEVEVGFDDAFETRWLYAARVGRIIMVLFTAAGLAGLMGQGPFSHRTVKSIESGLAIDFEPVARAQAGTQVTFHLDNQTGNPLMDLFISTNVVEPMGLQHALPEPVGTKVVKDGIVLTVSVPPGTVNGAATRIDADRARAQPTCSKARRPCSTKMDAVRRAMSVIIRAAIAYLILLFAVRLIGRRTASMMAPFDLVVLFLFGGALMGGVLANDHSMVAAVSAVFSIGLMHVLVSTLKAWSPRFGRMVDGTPVVIYERGQWHDDRMRGLRMLESDVMAAVRQNGLMRLEQVRYAIVERDGKVSIIPESSADGAA